MKKLVIIVILCFVPLLSSCAKETFFFNYVIDEIDRIEIIDVRKLRPDDFDLLKILNDEEKDEIIVALSKIEFKAPSFGMDPGHIKGICIRIFFKDDTHKTIGRLNNTSKNDNNTNYNRGTWSCSPEVWDTLISRFAYLDE